MNEDQVKGLVTVLDYNAKDSTASADEIIARLCRAGARRLDDPGWQQIAREVIRKTRGEPWGAGTRLKVVATAEFAYGTAFRPGDRVIVWSSERRDAISLQTYEVVRLSDGMHQILTYHQLEFPYEDLV